MVATSINEMGEGILIFETLFGIFQKSLSNKTAHHEGRLLIG